jgi:signal transduction histidine kinase
VSGARSIGDSSSRGEAVLKRKSASSWGPRGLAGPSILRAYLLLGSVVFAVTFLIYTETLVARIQRETEMVQHMFARFLESSLENPASSQEMDVVFSELIRRINFPVVYSDPRDTLRLSANFAIEPRRHRADQPPDIRRALDRMDSRLAPIVLETVGADGRRVVLGTLHRGESRLTRELRWIPPLQVVLVGVFMLLGLVGLRSLKAGEQRSVVVGMAKEAAHQLGTPLSSLMGWIELLRERQAVDDLDTVLAEMERDLARLVKVASRFEKIGSKARLDVQPVEPIVRETVHYFRHRLPRVGRKVEIRENYGLTPPVLANTVLLEWVLENLIKNSLDALDNSPEGIVSVDVGVEVETGEVRVTVEDNGKGIAPKDRTRIFRPGFSTKQAGWGLGLSMARRIVEEHHGGRLRLLSSEPGVGSRFGVFLPAASRRGDRE